MTLIEQYQIRGLKTILSTLQNSVDLSEYSTTEEINQKLATYISQGEGITIETDSETGIKTIKANRIELFEVVTILPDEGETNKIYLKSDPKAINNQFTEFVYIDDKWEVFGHIEVDLSGYSTTEQVQDFISTAKSEAILIASVDAINKTNQALADAKTYADDIGSEANIYADGVGLEKDITASIVSNIVTLKKNEINIVNATNLVTSEYVAAALTNHYTKIEVDDIVGDINTILDTIIGAS
jgi:hypothetical protein